MVFKRLSQHSSALSAVLVVVESVHTELVADWPVGTTFLYDFDPLDLSIYSCADRWEGQLSSGAGAVWSVLLLKSSNKLSQVSSSLAATFGYSPLVTIN